MIGSFVCAFDMHCCMRVMELPLPVSRGVLILELISGRFWWAP